MKLATASRKARERRASGRLPGPFADLHCSTCGKVTEHEVCEATELAGDDTALGATLYACEECGAKRGLS